MADNKLKKIKCPQCGRGTDWEGNPSRPFCSERCRRIDLGAWAGEEYRIPGEKNSPDDKPENDE